MTSEMGKHMWIASLLQSQNQGSLLKDISSTPTPLSSPFQMETFFSKNIDVHVQRQLDTYCFLLSLLIFEIELSNWIAVNLTFIVVQTSQSSAFKSLFIP